MRKIVLLKEIDYKTKDKIHKVMYIHHGKYYDISTTIYI